MARGPDEWLAEVRTGQYLPESDMKKLCEMVRIELEESRFGRGLGIDESLGTPDSLILLSVSFLFER